jgi:hypothetical protein
MDRRRITSSPRQRFAVDGTHSPSSLGVFRLPGQTNLAAVFVQSPLRDIAVPAVCLVGGLWTLLAWEVRRQARSSDRGNRGGTARSRVQLAVQHHQAQKWQLLRRLLPSMVLVCGLVQLAATGTNQRMMDGVGPAATMVGLSFAFWNAEMTLDLCLDECNEYKLVATKTVACIIMLSLIPVLIHNHPVFWIKACQAIVGTVVGGTLDHSMWSIVAGVAVFTGATMWKCNVLAQIPTSVSFLGWSTYLLVAIARSSLYQLVQNLAPAKRVAQLHPWQMLSAGFVFQGLVCLFVAGTPASWVLHDVANWALFLGLKCATDQVVLSAL